MLNPRWWPRNDCDGRLIENFNNDNSGEFGAKITDLNFMNIVHQFKIHTFVCYILDEFNYAVLIKNLPVITWLSTLKL